MTVAERKRSEKDAAEKAFRSAGNAFSKTHENRELTKNLQTTEDFVKHYLDNPWDGNYMISAENYKQLCDIFGWDPELDVCSDEFGTNSLCERFYSAKENSLRQSLGGWTILCNPPFHEKMMDRFTRKLERTMMLYPDDTEVMLVIPYKPSELHFKNFMDRNRWTLVAFLPLGW